MLLIGIALFVAIYILTSPVIGRVSYQSFPDGQAAGISVPFADLPTEDKLYVHIPVQLTDLQPATFYFRTQGCLLLLSVNGTNIPLTGKDADCFGANGDTLTLQHALHSGENMFDVVLVPKDGKAGFSFGVSAWDWLRVSVFVGIALLILWYIFCILDYAVVFPPRLPIILVIILGIVLRVLYVSATPPTVRSHDFDAHIEYIQYVADHGWMPSAQDGWEFHQAPLYYFGASALFHAEQFFRRSNETFQSDLQMISLLLSIGTLLIGMWIASMLFGKPKERWHHVLFTLVVATFPGLVFAAAQITNEVLSHFLGILAIALLIRYWQRELTADWYRLWFVIALGCITKISMGVFVPIALLVFYLKHRKKTWRQPALMYGLLALALFTAVAGWYPLARFTLEAKHSRIMSIGNEGMSEDLRVTTSLSHILVFSPGNIIHYPFNDPWKDDNRRQYFLEYAFKSAFFGEFSEPTARLTAQALLLAAMLSCVVLVYGLITESRDRFRASMPLIVVAIFIILAAIVYRLAFAYAPNQDFRFSIPVVIPLAYFLTRGTLSGTPLWRWLAISIVSVFITLCTLYLATIHS